MSAEFLDLARLGKNQWWRYLLGGLIILIAAMSVDSVMGAVLAEGRVRLGTTYKDAVTFGTASVEWGSFRYRCGSLCSPHPTLGTRKTIYAVRDAVL